MPPPARPPGTRTLLAVGEATSGVAHDLNNALGAIVMRASLIRAGSSDPEAREHARHILGAAEAADELMARVRTILRPAPEQAHERLDPRPLLTRACSWARPRAEARGIALRAALAPGALPEIAGAPGELSQLFANLLTNAIDASPDGATVEASLQPDPGGGVLCTIRDHGPGLDPAIRARLFEPFVSTKGSGGLGLGLSLCRRVATSHGARLTLEDAKGGGTRACLLFPPAPPDAPRPRRRTRLELEAEDTPATILIVEDDPSARAALAALLRATGHAVLSAADAAGALALAEGDPPPALAISDLHVGAESGLAILAALRRLHPEMPALLMSGDVTASPPDGVSFLRKPINPGSLMRLVRAALSPAPTEATTTRTPR